MSREPDTGVQREPRTEVQAPHAQDSEGAVTGTGLPGGGDECSSAGSASEPFTSVLALPPRPGTRARVLVTACAEGRGGAFEGGCCRRGSRLGPGQRGRRAGYRLARRPGLLPGY